jgi:ParB family chromosome partitioning protein
MPQKVSEIPVDRVKPSSFTLRDLDEAAVDELAGSIRASGLLQPIMVKPTGDGYDLVFGLHRLEAVNGWVGKKSQPSLSISQARTPS